MSTGELEEQRFAFRPWVRQTCRRAIAWGIGAVAILAAVTWLFRSPGSRPLSQAFGILAIYGLLFLLTLLKILWTAGRPAVVLDRESLAYQPLHTFRPKRIELAAVLSCAPRAGTQSLRLVHEAAPGAAREFFLNLGVIDRRTDFLARLGQYLEERGLAPVSGSRYAWRRPGWEEEAGD